MTVKNKQIIQLPSSELSEVTFSVGERVKNIDNVLKGISCKNVYAISRLFHIHVKMFPNCLEI